MYEGTRYLKSVRWFESSMVRSFLSTKGVQRFGSSALHQLLAISRQHFRRLAHSAERMAQRA